MASTAARNGVDIAIRHTMANDTDAIEADVVPMILTHS
jgi:hypothetical protein